MLDAAEHNETSSATEDGVTLLFIDLDCFILINDALGHEVGDRVLIQVGQRLKGAMSNDDQMIRRGRRVLDTDES